MSSTWKDNDVSLNHVSASTCTVWIMTFWSLLSPCSLLVMVRFDSLQLCPHPYLLFSHNLFFLSFPPSLCVFCFSSVLQAAEGGSLRKMLGSERGVVEEWLSEFKVKALLFSPPLFSSSWLMSMKCPERTTHCGWNDCDEKERGSLQVGAYHLFNIPL